MRGRVSKFPLVRKDNTHGLVVAVLDNVLVQLPPRSKCVHKNAEAENQENIREEIRGLLNALERFRH